MGVVVNVIGPNRDKTRYLYMVDLRENIHKLVPFIQFKNQSNLEFSISDRIPNMRGWPIWPLD